ncbi:MAG: glycoside hydrolase family 38 C-terminal domain-containing protein [Paludibacter sp.]|nr:glycoside hydrolase family 38 C-terminal domain-containing protein [Paludibacter sp.]
MFRFCISLSLLLTLTLSAQNVYFVDGYHGGIYGHYPLEWKTRFITDNFHKHPEWRISLEIEPETWDSVKSGTPEDYIRLTKIVNNERVEFTNPTYAQPYCYNISGESIIRQFQYGIAKLNNHFPDVKFNTYAVEEPCFTSSLPQLLKSFGFSYAVLKCPNTCWGGYTRAYGKDLVNWIGPDGTSILSVPRYECEQLEENSTWQTKAWRNSQSYIKDCFDAGIKNPVGMCFQDAGWKNGPWLGAVGNNVSNSKYLTWKEYFENVSSGETEDNWHFSQEDILVNLMWGSQVLQKIGQQVRKAENKIVAAEKMGALAYLDNKYNYQQDRLDEAWRTLMLAQHHDSWIVPYNRLRDTRTWADEIGRWTYNTNEIADEIMLQATKSFELNIPIGEDFIRIYNTLGFSRKEIVSIPFPEKFIGTNFILLSAENKEIPYSINTEDEKSICFQADVPSFGYATYKITKGESGLKNNKQKLLSDKNVSVLENDMYRIVFDLQKGGTIRSLIVKNNDNKEYVKKDGDYLLGEIRGFFYDEKQFHSSKNHPAKATVLKDNAHESSILIQGEIASHPYKQLVTIRKEQEEIDFELEIDWKHHVGIGEYKQQSDWRDNRRAFTNDKFKLSVLFPVDLTAPKLYKNAPFDVCESRLENTFFSSWDSIKHNIILNWVDLSEAGNGNSMALFTDHTTSYSYGKDFPLGLTIQYSGKGLWGHDYKISGPSKVKYALVPHKNKWDKSSMTEKSLAWNEPLVSHCTSNLHPENRSFIDLQNSGYELSAVLTKNDGVLVRIFNAKGDDSAQKIKLNFPYKSIEVIELNGEAGDRNALIKESSNNELSLSIPQFGLRTFYIKI